MELIGIHSSETSLEQQEKQTSLANKRIAGLRFSTLKDNFFFFFSLFILSEQKTSLGQWVPSCAPGSERGHGAETRVVSLDPEPQDRAGIVVMMMMTMMMVTTAHLPHISRSRKWLLTFSTLNIFKRESGN